MAKDITIKNPQGTVIYYPKTVSQLVYDNDSGKTVKEDMDEIKSHLLKKTDIQSRDVTEETMYIAPNGNITSTTANMYVYFYEVVGGKTYCIKNTNHSGTYNKYAVYNSTQTDSTTCLVVGGRVNTISSDDSYITVPNNAVTIAVTRYGSNEIGVSECEYINVEQIEEEIVDISDAIFDGGYWRTVEVGQTITKQSGTNLYSTDIVLNGGISKVNIDTFANTTICRPYVITDKDYNVLYIEPQTTVEFVRTLTQEDFPNGAAHLLVNFYYSEGRLAEPKVEVVTNKIDGKIAYVQEEVDELQNSVGYIINESDITFVDGKYVSINKNVGDYFGGVLSNANGKLATIDLDQQFESITFTTCGASNITRLYAIVDDNGIILQLADTYRKSTITLYKDELPPKSKTLYINFWVTANLDAPSGTIRVNNIDSASKDIEILKKKLYGKRIICFGDSITEGVGNSVNDSLTSWVDYLGEYFGATVTKMGVGGSHLTPQSVESGQSGLFVYRLIEAWYTKDYTDMDASIEWAHSTSYGTRWDHVQYNIKNTSPTDYDVVTIAAGTNDWNSKSLSLGEWSDTDPTWNITASLKGIIRMLQEMNPNLYILIVPPIPRYIKRDGESGSNKDIWNESTNFSDNYKDTTQVNYYLWEVSEKMNEVAKKCHTQSIESYWEAFGFNWDAWKLFTTDGTHLNAKGYKAMAERIGNYLVSNYCRHY